LKRRRLILGVFLGTVAVTVVLSLLMPKIYKVDTSLEVGARGGGKDLELIVTEDPLQLAAKINNDAFGAQVRETLGIEGGDFPEVKAENPTDTKLIELEVESADPQQAKGILEEINKLILADHQERTKVRKELLEEDIERSRTKIKSLENEKKNIGAKVRTLQQTPASQQSPGSQFALFDAKENLETKKQEIEDLYLRIINFQQAVEDVQPTKVVKSPFVSTEAVRPKPLLNGVIAAVLGLFLGTLLAFAKEWWKASFR
jgi:uncharacterized protein involved in exopolysaccharide biosynthesis